MDDIGRLTAIEEIKILKARYLRAVDEKDRTLLRSTFTDDVTVDYREAATDPATGFDAVASAAEAIFHGGDAATDAVLTAVAGLTSVHHGHMPEIEITGLTTATGIWAMVDILRFGPGAPLVEMVGYGHYRESYRCVDGSWRISSLRLTRLRVDAVMASHPADVGQPSG